MRRSRIKQLLKTADIGAEVKVCGWVRTFRNNQFIALNDGSTIKTIQCVVDYENTNAELLKSITTGAAVQVEGTVVESQGRGQSIEIKAVSVTVLGAADPERYPLQPKRHSLEFLREIAHLRFRTNTFGAVFRIRHATAYAIHQFFNDRGFVYLHSPIITGSDAEGAGEMFQVTAMDLDNPPRTEDGKIDFKKDFFGTPTNLTVSGQLEAELGALALSDVYTFGPTFRAENSNTSRHLAEFWMIEPEIAFADIHDDMDLAEDLLKYVIAYVMEHCDDDLEFLEQRLINEEKNKPQNERSEYPLREKLQFCLDNDYERLTYTEAIDILMRSKPNKKKKFQFVIEEWGADLQSEHERYLVEKHFKKPVILTAYPKEIKAFYMRVNDDDKTVAAMDILFPGIGEIVGGSQREERIDILRQRMVDFDIHESEMDWFLDTRRFGTCPHAGFGLGFERLVMFVTGMTNIRDVIPFPRFPGSAAF
ncbi:MAG: asparagine--tRNA ligase [Bacteroidota bacterium]